VLHDKLRLNPQSAFFQKPENQVYLSDRVSWIQQLFDRAADQHAGYAKKRAAVAALRQECAGGFAALTTVDLRRLLEQIRDRLSLLLRENELNGVLHADLVLLKDLFVRGQAELAGREGPGGTS
jgi:hypothetical protein